MVCQRMPECRKDYFSHGSADMFQLANKTDIAQKPITLSYTFANAALGIIFCYLREAK